jgi:hypothetical protein
MTRAQGGVKVNSFLLLLFCITSAWLLLVTVASYPSGPNQLLGTCLDSAWVTQMELKYGISSKERDASGRLIHPFLQKALQYPRFTVRFVVSQTLQERVLIL